jgi:hypothetical protein
MLDVTLHAQPDDFEGLFIIRMMAFRNADFPAFRTNFRAHAPSAIDGTI